MSYFNRPDRWDELSDEQKFLVQRYINTLLANQTRNFCSIELPMIQKANREVVDRKIIKGVNYQHELIKCGKKTCKCAKGELHGPYWYAYWRDGKRVKSKYLGKNFRVFHPGIETDRDVPLT